MTQLLWLLPYLQRHHLLNYPHQKMLEMSFVRVPSLFFYKNFLPAIHPAELYNYSQSLTHHGDDGSCCSNIKSIDLEQRVHLRELSNGPCSLFPQGWSTFYLWVSKGSSCLLSWCAHLICWWFCYSPQLHANQRTEGGGKVQRMYSSCFWSHVSYALLPSCPFTELLYS